jgi:hypothetical protein
MMIAYLLQDQMVFDTVTSYMMLFGILGILIGLLYQTNDLVNTSSNMSIRQYAIGSIVTIGAVIIFISWVIIPTSTISRFYELSNETSEARTQDYKHLFTGLGSKMIQNQVSVYVDTLVLSYTSQEKTLFADQDLRMIAANEITTLGNVLEPVWEKRSFDYHLTFSLAQLQNLSFIFNGQVDAEGLARAEKYEEQGIVLSPTDPQIYATYAQTLAFAGDTKNALIMVQKSLDLNPHYQFATHLKSLLVGKNP